MSNLLLGLDIGTSSVKGLVITPDGRTLARAEAPHDLLAPRPGWAEEDPAAWWSNAVTVIRRLLDHPAVDPARLAAAGVTGMLPALVLLDRDGRPLRPAIQQTDTRAQAEIERVAASLPADFFLSKTGSSLSQQSIGPKLLWLQQHEPQVWNRTAALLGSYDFINFKLTGALSIERNWALESGLYDLESESWSAELLALFATPPNLLPPVHKPDDIIGRVTPEAAAATGLPAGLPVVAGTADHVGAAFAAGIVDDGDLLIKFGSAGDILYSTTERLVDPRLFLDYHNLPGKFLVNGCMATSGSLIKWLVNEFFTADAQAAAAAGRSVYADLDERAARLPAGSDGVLILPYFLGEKTPILDPHARGVIFGLTLFHGRDHVYRAALESVVYGFRHHVEVLRERGRSPRRVVAGEGGARSPLWRQIAADVLDLPIAFLQDDPGAALAAAFAAGMGVGAFSAWDEIERFVTLSGITHPNPEHVPVYDRAFGRYRELYEHLKEDFKRI